jgi:hypothetical protein
MNRRNLPQLSVMSAMLSLLVSGAARLEYGPTTRNRFHTDKAPLGSAEEQERKAAAGAKRARKAAKRLGK